MVVGGGNSAFQETLFLTRYASHIDLLIRSSVKASEVLQKELQPYLDQGKVTIHAGVTPQEIVGDEQGVTKVLAVDAQGEKREFPTDGVFVFIGLRPNSSFLKDTPVHLDQAGFILTDANLSTNVKGVFAAGDVRSGATMQIASAAGEGATAALKIREFLEGHL